MVSYKNTAVAAQLTNDSIFVYPNPIHSNYTGLIAIKGLVKNANVKITDVVGNLVFETVAKGGQAVWDGRNFKNEKVSTGVYLVFVSNDDASQTKTTKLLILK
jgi:hypothetical protein